MTSLFGIALTILQLFDLHYGKPLIPTLSLAQFDWGYTGG